MNATVNNATFGLKGKRACISGKKKKEQYMEYQDQYRAMYGVYPELDRIHNPFTARWDEIYNCFCELRKSGVDGALLFHDLHNRYRKRIRYIYEHYSWEWSFLVSIDLDHRTILRDIPNMAPAKNIVNNLGYYKAENGNYYEGTWQNGYLVYGLVYLAEQDVFFIGSFDESGRSDCRGVTLDFGDMTKKQRQVTIVAGNFRVKNGSISLYDSKYLCSITNIKNDEPTSIDTYAGEYVEGYEEGTTIHKEFSNDNIRIGWDKYREGEIKSSGFALEGFLRLLMMLYMLMWYMIKYTYGIFLFILPLYYSLRKKNWKI